MIQALEHDLDNGNVQRVKVYEKGKLENAQTVDVGDVRIGELGDRLDIALKTELEREFGVEPWISVLAGHLDTWLGRRDLPTTLTWNRSESDKARDKAGQNVPVLMKRFEPGHRLEYMSSVAVASKRILAGQPIDQVDLELLRAEHDAMTAGMSWWTTAMHSLSDLGMFAAMYMLCGFYMHYRQRHLLIDFKHLATIIGLSATTVCVVWLVSNDRWRAELIPVVFFSMTISIAYRHELALLLSTVVALVSVISIGQGLEGFVVMVAASSTASFLCGSIRSRTKLVYVGLAAGAVAFLTSLGVNVMTDIPLDTALLKSGAWFGISALLAGLLMTGILPFMERPFNLETDISLLEFGDAAHPLLQEMVRSAPGTYNHSINVASIAEAAAVTIGANGLLCRVAAYFHDIGKMRKPEYFVENQGTEANKHDTLVPAMSTLVIIAHVKDGVEMARAHKLPQRIIDLIEQHHGTTLVEYFFDQATRQNEETENGEVDEASYRYPGPKPQTREAAVIMLADAVESASRSLIDPAPSRIESLVLEISNKKMQDGQFNDCSLTLSELNLIGESLVKSLTAVFHGRVKYPEQQQTA